MSRYDTKGDSLIQIVHGIFEYLIRIELLCIVSNGNGGYESTLDILRWFDLFSFSSATAYIK